MHIETKAYKDYEICILSEQIEQSEALNLMRLNPEFEAWFFARRKEAEIIRQAAK